MRLWLFFLPFTCVTSYAGIVYQSECEIMDMRAGWSVVQKVTGGQSCSAQYGGTAWYSPSTADAWAWDRGLSNISVSVAASRGGEPDAWSPEDGHYAGRSSITADANDHLRVFGADVAAIHFDVFWGWQGGGGAPGSAGFEFRLNGTPLDLQMNDPFGWVFFTLPVGSTFDFGATLIAGITGADVAMGANSGGGLGIGSIELLDANGQSLSGYTWASQSGWNYNFIGGQQVFTPEPVATLPIGALLLIAYEAIRRHRAARRSAV